MKKPVCSSSTMSAVKSAPKHGKNTCSVSQQVSSCHVTVVWLNSQETQMLTYVVEVNEAGNTYDMVDEATLQVCTAKSCLCTCCTLHHQYLSLQVQPFLLVQCSDKCIPAIMSMMVFQLQWFKSAEKAMVIGTRNAEYVPSNIVITMPCHADTCTQ